MILLRVSSHADLRTGGVDAIYSCTNLMVGDIWDPSGNPSPQRDPGLGYMGNEHCACTVEQFQRWWPRWLSEESPNVPVWVLSVPDWLVKVGKFQVLINLENAVTVEKLTLGEYYERVDADLFGTYESGWYVREGCQGINQPSTGGSEGLGGGRLERAPSCAEGVSYMV